MRDANLKLITVESTKSVYDGCCLDNDLIIFDDFNDVPLPNEPRRIGCLLLALCTRGRAQYTVDTEQHEIETNDMMIISEGQVTDKYMLSPDCNGIALMISSKFFSEIIKGVHELSSLFLFSRNHPVCELTAEEVETIKTYVSMMKQKVENTEHHFRKDTVRSLITSMIYDLSNEIYRIQQNNPNRTSAEAIFAKYIKLVEQHCRHERRVGWYATQMCITPKYLSETIKHVSHRTPSEWIDKYVTREIMVMLKNTTKSIKEISVSLNFSNQSFFGKYFKEHAGVSPSEYRRK